MPTKKAPAKKSTKPADATNKVFVSIVLDRSGSMSSTRAETVSGLNAYVNQLRKDKKTEYAISLTQFDTHNGPELTVTYENKPLSEIRDLTLTDYEPRGLTPLYDAVGECARRVGDDKGRAVIMVVITDGHENASREFSLQKVKDLIKSKEQEGWTFVFLGADIDSYAAGSSLGVNVNSTSNYQKGAENVMYANLAQSTMMRSQAVRTHGIGGASVMSFFDDKQKVAMEAKPAPSTAAGGPQAARGGFRQSSAPVDDKPGWTVSNS